MYKLFIIAVLCCALLLRCGNHPSASDGNGGGASETVASLYIENGDIIVRVSGEKPFLVTVTVCSENYSRIDTNHFIATTELANDAPEWKVPKFTDQRVNILIVNNIDGLSTVIPFSFEVSIRDPLYSSRILDTTGVVEGIVTEKRSDGTVVPSFGAKVVVRGTIFEAVTDATGAYRIEAVPAGTYVLNAVKLNKATYYSLKDTLVDISGDTTRVVDITLE